MRALSLLLMLLIPLASASADSSCNSVIKAFQTLAKAPHFTIFEADVDTPSQRTIQIQGRPDGIYEPSVNGKISVLSKEDERAQFSAETAAMIKERWSAPEYKCVLEGEEKLNGKATKIYSSEDDRFWIGKDDGLFYQMLHADQYLTLTYGS